MKSRTRLAPAALVLLLVAPAPVAVAGKGAVSLPPGPNTIGGPGHVVNLQPGVSENVFESYGASEIVADICITVVVTGRAPVQVSLLDPLATQTPSIVVDPGDSGVVCLGGADLGVIGCPSSNDADCDASWRLDEF